MVTGDILIFLPLLVSVGVYLVVPSLSGRWPITILIALTLLHIGTVGLRWQIVPVYLLVLVLVSVWAIGHRPRLNSLFGALTVIACLSTIAASVLLSTLFPLFNLPLPTGPHEIGTRFFQLEDPERSEPLTLAADDPRVIYIQAWYPAQPEPSGKPLPYLREAWKTSAVISSSQGLGFLPFLWSHLGLVRTHAYRDAPIDSSETAYPVVIFSHGYGQVASFNTALVEEMTSWGYVVLSLYHPYETPFVIDESGMIMPTVSDQTALDVLREESLSSGSRIAQLRDTSGMREPDEQLRHVYLEEPFWADRTDWWAEDILMVTRNIAVLSDRWFESLLDTERIAAMGWSFGGGAAGVATLVDSSITAGVNIDGWQYGHLLAENLRSPFLFLMSENHSRANQFFLDRAEADAYRLTVLGARHSNFTDLALLAALPGRLLGYLGAIDGKRGGEVARKYVIEFLARYLKGEDSGFLSGPSQDYPEVAFEGSRP